MAFTEPTTFFLGQPKLNRYQVNLWLKQMEAEGYGIPVATDAEVAIEVAGRRCYKSFVPGLNPNVTRVREGNDTYLENIHKVAHGSVEEHAYFVFAFEGVSRVFTHELVRHRAGVGISQESLRYVRLEEVNYWIPTILKEEDPDGEGMKTVKWAIEQLHEIQRRLQDVYKIEERKGFSIKKKLTSAFRRFAGMGVTTGMIWSANANALRHIIQMRTSPAAEEEIRLVFGQVATIMRDQFPNLFEDFGYEIVDGLPYWTSCNAKMPYDVGKMKKLQEQLARVEQKALARGWDSQSESLEDFLGDFL